MKRICVVTGTRAEYGLLKPLLHELEASQDLELQLVATAMHLVPEFGFTVDTIIADGFSIAKRVPCLDGSDTALGVSKSIATALTGLAEAFEDLKPDIVVILGDRSEMLAAATAATIANIPIAHIHGGETTEGAYDEAIRHAITKMSYWHFTSTETYRKRVIQLGEHPDRVFNVGAIGLDGIRQLELLSKADLEVALNFKLDGQTALITYHPETIGTAAPEQQFQTLLDALETQPDLKLIFTYANSDKGGRMINQRIEAYVKANAQRAMAIPSLGQLRYLSALQHVDVVLGNSSSGIIEVPYFNIPTINIGNRQKGRVMPESVLSVPCETRNITKSLEQALSPEFRSAIAHQEQLYGDGHATEEIIRVLRDSKPINLQKPFYDLP
ncbi:UDP-N-acetylglucosamine 2-epimerase [uncultured Winogradskyella sp.]|uniref:UDP-N-acetylglucosamine 2-epimerase n=1 Tax=uncultured Winogradskyella sp. TaxID=395353 RepID=UPI003512CD51